MSSLKIQELSSSSKDSVDSKPVKKNPFARKTATTVRRTAEEVYPSRRGLNKLDFIGDKPIDKLFQKLDQILDAPCEKLTVGLLFERIYGNTVAVSSDESSSGGSSGGGSGISISSSGSSSSIDSRYKVVDYLMSCLSDLQKASLQSVMANKSLMTISLHDIKTFSKLVNTILILGVYPALNRFKIGIPFEKRNLKDLANNTKPIVIDHLPSDSVFAIKLLTLIYNQFYILFKTPSDVTDLLKRGTGLSDFITIALALQTIPGIDHTKFTNDYPSVEKIPDSYELFQTYSLLLTTPSPSYFKQFIMQRIQRLPYDAPRKDGLLSLIEFILGLRDSDEIDITKFDHVANVILSKPKDIPTKEYFASIGHQSFDLLVNINRPTVAACVTYVIEKLWNKNKLVVEDFFLQRIWNSLNPKSDDENVNVNVDENENENENVYALVSEKKLNNVINVLLSMSKKGLEASLYQAVMEPVIVPLWGYYLFLKQNGKPIEIVTNIMTSYFTVMKDFDDSNLAGVDLIAKNLLFSGGDNWMFEIGPNNLTQIIQRKAEFSSESKEMKLTKFIDNLDFACRNFVKLLENVDDEIVQALFITILKQWFTKKSATTRTTFVLADDENPFIKLVDLKLLESIGHKFKDSLARTPYEMLSIVDSFLNTSFSNKEDEDEEREEEKEGKTVDSDDEEEEDDAKDINDFLPILLELLSAILSEDDLVIDEKCTKLLADIKTCLMHMKDQSLNVNVKNSVESLAQRIANILNGDFSISSELDAQKLMLNRAITSLNDPLVPIRAHGLYLLRQLVESQSTVISLDFAINLHLVQLKDPEPYIYLNVIKGLESLIEWEELPVLKILCDLYTNSETDLDERLRIGEVILRYIQVANEKFVGESANLVVATTLVVIRKHGDDDDRVRMSAMSLLGVCCKVNPLGLIGSLDDALDCAIGILNLEKTVEKAVMRRAAVMLIQDLILGTSETNKVEFPEKYREKVVVLLRYIVDTDNDIFVREQAQKVLSLIQELAKLAIQLAEEEVFMKKKSNNYQNH
ncbi:hypothetical protein KGF56_000630 [Candida oxycetoniae]|uniref:RNA polymerase II assembly factor Rtp1 C-terminal domain-containing protein n=1 Tax=Candida oxycetoniae TaxID=497107 RepID=A0AAI9T0F2_9ASCO|nr:uncharacterized protein KGF56_000630 [Candida oxycetoniae]KAI3406498.2 hypothetical protein KGF56_000630 [Candida oxycetoniae]